MKGFAIHDLKMPSVNDLKYKQACDVQLQVPGMGNNRLPNNLAYVLFSFLSDLVMLKYYRIRNWQCLRIEKKLTGARFYKDM